MHDSERKEQTEYESKQATQRAVRRRFLRQQTVFQAVFALACIAILSVATCQVIRFIKSRETKPVVEEVPTPKKIVLFPPEYDVQLLSVNAYSRPGEPLEQVNGVVVHYTANPGTTAQQNRYYFEGLSLSQETYASSHFVIGLEGELIQCIPSSEIAYASNERNEDTIAIECCIPDETGKFTEATYQTLVHLTAWLMGNFDLEIDDVIRHYDVTGKNCPKYFVEYPSAWITFQNDVCNYIETYGTVETEGTEIGLPNEGESSTINAN